MAATRGKTSGSASVWDARTLWSIRRAERRTAPPGDVRCRQPEDGHQDQEAGAGRAPGPGRAAPERRVFEGWAVRGSSVRVETLLQRVHVENSVAIRVVTL